MEQIRDTLARENFPKSTGARSKSSKTWVADQDIIDLCAERKERDGYAPNPSCPVCHGAGFVHPLLPDGKPNYSEAIWCHTEGCIESQKRAFASTDTFIKTKGVNKLSTFENFKPALGADATLEAFKDIATNAEAPPLLLVYGQPGNGKTHLCEATVFELLKRGVDCRLWAVADLVSDLKQSISENTTELLMVKLKTIPALILDDWGQNYGSDWEVQKLEEIIIARERVGLITIITSNLEPLAPGEKEEERGQMRERLVSRFRDATEARMILNSATDYRPEKKRRK